MDIKTLWKKLLALPRLVRGILGGLFLVSGLLGLLVVLTWLMSQVR